MPNYWLVGATWDKGDQTAALQRRGYWRLDWEDKDQPQQAARRNQVQAGDRIAIKKMLGQGSSEIEIRAIGIVRENDLTEGRIYVDWIVTDLQRRVESRGCFQSIHGPYSSADDWTRQVFVL